MTDTKQSGTTVEDVLEVVGANLEQVADAARAAGLTIDELCATNVGSMDADTLRAVCVALRRDPDEVLAIASMPADELDRRRALAHARTEHEDAATVLAARAQGVAHLLKKTGYASGTDREQGAAFDLLADALEEAAEAVELARDELERLQGAPAA